MDFWLLFFFFFFDQTLASQFIIQTWCHDVIMTATAVFATTSHPVYMHFTALRNGNIIFFFSQSFCERASEIFFFLKKTPLVRLWIITNEKREYYTIKAMNLCFVLMFLFYYFDDNTSGGYNSWALLNHYILFQPISEPFYSSDSWISESNKFWFIILKSQKKGKPTRETNVWFPS